MLCLPRLVVHYSVHLRQLGSLLVTRRNRIYYSIHLVHSIYLTLSIAPWLPQCHHYWTFWRQRKLHMSYHHESVNRILVINRIVLNQS